jgi:HEAT repeat protein
MTITPESVQQLLNSEDLGDRLQGVNRLRTLEPKAAFEMLKPMIHDRNPRVRYAAVSQLDTLGRQDLEISLSLLRDRLLNDDEPDVQAAAADAIGGLQLTAAYEDIEKVYHETSQWLVQFSIIAALGELGDPRGFELLKEALTSDINLVQTAAISSFGELGNIDAVPLIAPFASHEDWQIRYRLVQALGHLGGSEANSALEALANDEIEQVATAAKTNLGARE